MKILLGLLLSIALTRPAMAYQLPETQAGPVSIALDRIELTNVGFDRMNFSIESHVTSSRRIKVRQIRFAGMHLGDLPIYPAPIDQPMTLARGDRVILPPILVAIYFKDLQSLKPLEEMIRDGVATVQGEIQVDVDLNRFERWIGGSLLAHTAIPLKMTIPIKIPGGAAGQLAALAALHAAQLVLTLGGFRSGNLPER